LIASLNPIPTQSRWRRGAGRPRGVVALDHVITYNNEDGRNSLYFRVDKKSSINNSRLVIKDQYNEIIPNFNAYNVMLQMLFQT
jgi:hypothetical protein